MEFKYKYPGLGFFVLVVSCVLYELLICWIKDTSWVIPIGIIAFIIMVFLASNCAAYDFISLKKKEKK